MKKMKVLFVLITLVLMALVVASPLFAGGFLGIKIPKVNLGNGLKNLAKAANPQVEKVVNTAGDALSQGIGQVINGKFNRSEKVKNSDVDLQIESKRDITSGKIQAQQNEMSRYTQDVSEINDRYRDLKNSVRYQYGQQAIEQPAERSYLEEQKKKELEILEGEKRQELSDLEMQYNKNISMINQQFQ